MALTTATAATDGTTTGTPRPTVIAADPATLDWAALRRVYPESDGQPMSDNTKQFRYILTIAGGLDALFRDDPDVFVAGDLLWYPVEHHREIRQAPDALVVFGRPKGDRGSYLQWLEGGVAPQVVFEVLSPRNTAPEMARKRAFYGQYGVEEYYEYDPDRGHLRGWQRRGNRLEGIADMRGWVSPRLGVRFDLEGGELRLFGPDERAFASYVEVEAEREQATRRAEQERARAEQERARAEQERARAEQERARAEQANQRAAHLAARLRALGIDPDVE
jgi:Uma2 family endonuclease